MCRVSIAYFAAKMLISFVAIATQSAHPCRGCFSPQGSQFIEQLPTNNPIYALRTGALLKQRLEQLNQADSEAQRKMMINALGVTWPAVKSPTVVFV